MVTGGAFALLCGLALRRGVEYRHASGTWLAVSFAAIAVAGATVPQVDGARTPAGQYLALAAVAASLLLHPVAIVMFAHGVEPVRRRWRLATAAVAALLLAGILALAAVDPTAFGDVAPSPVADAMLVVVSLVWLGTAAAVGARLLRMARRLTSSVGRARARMMAAGVLALGPAVALPFLVPALTDSTGVFFALWACALTWAGFAPTRGLRAAWARPDTRRLTEVELATLRDPSTSLQPWLDAVLDVWDAEAAWLEDGGRVLAGSGPAVPDDPVAAPSATDHVAVERLDDDGWLLTAPALDGVLVVRTRLDPVLFGDRDFALLLATAGRLRSTLARRDLEQRQRDELSRRQAALHLAETVQLRDDVLSTLSHELRTPLVTLRGVPELLLRQWSAIDGRQRTELLRRMHDNALTLHRLVESTLLLAAVRAGEQRMHVEEVAVGHVVSAALARLDRVGVEVGRVRVVGDDAVPVHTDVRHAGAMLAEVVHNALTYSDAPSPVEVELRADGHDVVVRVVDRGRGVSSADRDHMLDAFGRAGDVLHRDRRGLGIGLTLVHELLSHLQAQLEVQGTDGGGAVVSVRLPAAATGHGLAVPIGRARRAG